MRNFNEPGLEDSSTAFVQWLTSKTLNSYARWEKRPNGLISHLYGSMFVQFITQVSERGQAWCLFRVRDSNGELLRATPAVSSTDTSPLARAVEALFLTVTWSGPDLIH